MAASAGELFGESRHNIYKQKMLLIVDLLGIEMQKGQIAAFLPILG